MKQWLNSRISISWQLAWLAIGIITGTVLCLKINSNTFSGPQWLITSIALFFMVLVRRVRAMVMLAIIAGLMIGLWRGSIAQQELEQYKPYYKQTVTLSGHVVQDTSSAPGGDQRLRLGNVRIGKQLLSGEVWVSSATRAEIKRSDRVSFKGNLSDGFGSASATMFRAELVSLERPRPGDIALRVRDWFAGGVRRSIPEPEASLGIGYLVGQRSALPETLEQQTRTVGLSHVVVASGYNLMILVMFTRRLLAGKSKYLAALAGGIMIGGFMLVTGFTPSMARAGLVSGLSLVAWYYGRKIHPLVLLPAAAAMTVLIRPSYLWGDIGWYLSFTSFVGVIVLAPLLQHFFWGIEKKLSMLGLLIIGTISAQLVTMPIILLTFRQYSPYALLANILVLPLVPLAMLCTFLAGLAGLVVPGLALWFGLPAAAILRYSTYVIERIANLPGAQNEITFSPSMLIMSYVGLILFMAFLVYKTKHNFSTDDTIA